MTTYAGDKPILLIKKFAALILLLFGVLLTATGFANNSSGLAVVGALLLAVGALILVLKIARRNRAATRAGAVFAAPRQAARAPIHSR